MSAAVLHKNCGWQRLYIFCISYFLIRGLSPPTASNDLNNVSNSFYAGKIISSPQLSSTLLKAKNKPTGISTTTKLARLSRLVQYWSLAFLLLLSGDICPTPGWASSVLNSRGLKIAHLNIRSLLIVSILRNTFNEGNIKPLTLIFPLLTFSIFSADFTPIFIILLKPLNYFFNFIFLTQTSISYFFLTKVN